MKKIILSLFVASIFLVFVISSCTSRNEEEYFAVQTVDTTGNNQDTTTLVSYQNDIAPIIAGNCSGCHQGGAQSGGVSMNNYAEFSSKVDRVVVMISKTTGFMPKGGQKLPAAKIELINTWKNQGKKDN